MASNTIMKILIGYDGSECSDAALDDIKTAGFPEKVEAVVMSVAEVWLPPPPIGETLSEYATDLQKQPQPFKAYQTHAKAVTEAEALARQGQHRLLRMFPGWSVAAEPNYGSPAWEIISRADEIKADLIVVGSHGRSAVGRLFLGSISQKVLTEAHCSVRVARGRVEVDPGPCRMVIGFDGTAGAKAAVSSVTSRCWPDHSQVKLVSVSDVSLGVDISVRPAVNLPENSDWLCELADESMRSLRNAGLETEFVFEIGTPKSVLVDIAESWHADSIFVGANRWGSRVERFLLGSVSAAVAARAQCSVEVVRIP